MTTSCETVIEVNFYFQTDKYFIFRLALPDENFNGFSKNMGDKRINLNHTIWNETLIY